ncbi:MAG: hypothetical protein K9N51_11345 [Candidatus Pacebacteria bacterium]|nr:hypothetical protein [Candidatus Paceibacterota bacterium]
MKKITEHRTWRCETRRAWGLAGPVPSGAARPAERDDGRRLRLTVPWFAASPVDQWSGRLSVCVWVCVVEDSNEGGGGQRKTEPGAPNVFRVVPVPGVLILPRSG